MLLSNGEGVVTAKGMKQLGEKGLAYINTGKIEPAGIRSSRLNDSGVAAGSNASKIDGFIGIGLDEGLQARRIEGTLLQLVREKPRTIKRLLGL